MEYFFVADEAKNVIDLETVITGVCHNSTSEYLMFQRGVDINNDDDWGVYLELNNQGNSAYEIIEFCHLTPDILVVLLSKPIDTKNEFTKIEVMLKIERVMLEDLSQSLQKIFIDRLDLLDINI